MWPRNSQLFRLDVSPLGVAPRRDLSAMMSQVRERIDCRHNISSLRWWGIEAPPDERWPSRKLFRLDSIGRGDGDSDVINGGATVWRHVEWPTGVIVTDVTSLTDSGHITRSENWRLFNILRPMYMVDRIETDVARSYREVKYNNYRDRHFTKKEY